MNETVWVVAAYADDGRMWKPSTVYGPFTTYAEADAWAMQWTDENEDAPAYVVEMEMVK